MFARTVCNVKTTHLIIYHKMFKTLVHIDASSVLLVLPLYYFSPFPFDESSSVLSFSLWSFVMLRLITKFLLLLWDVAQHQTSTEVVVHFICLLWQEVAGPVCVGSFSSGHDPIKAIHGYDCFMDNSLVAYLVSLKCYRTTSIFFRKGGICPV